MPTRINRITSSITDVAYLFAHGDPLRDTVVAHNQPLQDTFFRLPPNVSVSFISKPGYLLTGDAAVGEGLIKFGELVRSKNTSLRLVRGDRTLLPQTLINRNWYWQNHVHEAGSLCPDLKLNFRDTEIRAYDGLMGITIAGGNLNKRYLYGSNNLTLSYALHYFSKYKTNQNQHWMLFVYTCRYFPGAIPAGATARQQQLQNHPLIGNNHRFVANYEARAAQMLKKKRVASASPENRPSTKKLRITPVRVPGRSTFKSSRKSPKTRVLGPTTSGIRKK